MRNAFLRRGLSVAIISALGLGATPGLVAAADTAGLCQTPDLGGRVLKRIETRSAQDRAFAAQVGTLVEDYGSYQVVAVDEAAASWAKKTHFGAPASADIETEISLRFLRFDPAAFTPAAVSKACENLAKVDAAAPGYYLVQFHAPAQDAWLEAVRAAGAEVLQYVPSNAFLVHGSRTALSRVAALPVVRWAAPHAAAFKVGPELAWAVDANASRKDRDAYGKAGPALYDVAVFSRADLGAVRNRLAVSAQAEVVAESVLPNNFFNVLRVRLDPAAVKRVLESPDVFAVDPYIAPQAEDERAAHIVAGNYTGTGIGQLAPPGYDPMTQFGVDGTGITVAVVDDGVGIPGDGGFYVTAANNADGPLRGATAGAQGHGHLQSSIIAGATPFSVLDPLGYNFGRGIAPNAHIVNIPLLRTGYTGTDLDAQQDPFLTNGPNGIPARMTNNSWGAGLNGNAYDAMAASFDGFVRDVTSAPAIDPLLILFSAGNQGASGLTRPKVAKNVISVASSENLRPDLDAAANDIEQISDFSSRGLAADGRIKPDIAAPGQAVSGGRSGPDVLFGNIGTFHRWSTGTSHAVPQVAGALALFQQWWANSHAGALPSPALAKAAIINGAVEMTGATTTTIPNGAEGWGRINLSNVINTGIPTIINEQATTLSAPGQFLPITAAVANAAEPVRVTLVWTDPPGASDPALVNNLDLEVVNNGNTYRGNVFTGGLSATGGTADTRNNVENVFLPVGTTGTIAVRVTATALNGDGVLGNADLTDQHFALVVQNATAVSVAVIGAGGSSLVSESCTPANGVLDPGETVTTSLGLQNLGTADTVNAVGTLQTTGNVTAPSGPQTYGVLVQGGPAVSRNFTFTAAPAIACGATVTPTLQVQDGATNLGNVSYTFTTGVGGSPTPTPVTNAAAIGIPDSGVSPLYPSPITVAGVTGTVTNVTVRLNNFTHTFPNDVDVLLVGPTGASTVVMSDVGGEAPVTGVNVTLDDDAPSAVPAPVTTGTFRPSNVTTETFPGPAPAGPYGATFAGFDGQNPNGQWRLFVVDDAAQDLGSIAGGWTLTIVTTSPPTCATSCAAAGTPTITPAVGVARSQGAAGSVSTIATVADTNTPVASLVVTTTSVPTGLTVDTIANTAGTITANVTAACAATPGNNTVGLQVSDGALSSTGDLTVNVTANTAPTLGTYGATSVAANGGTTVTPSAAPADNGTFASITAAATGFTGTLSVDPVTGVVTVSNAGPFTPTPYNVVVTATDNCGLVTTSNFALTVTSSSSFALGDVTVTEGDGGTVNLAFPITRTGADGNYSVDIATVAGGTATAGADYTALPATTVNFTGSQTSQVANVVVAGDLLDENAETVLAQLSNTTGGATIGDANGTGTITDNDAPPSISVNAPTVVEGDSGTVTLQFQLSLSAISGLDVGVTRGTADGTATIADGDYVAVPASTVIIPAGQTGIAVQVTVNGDEDFEANETVQLVLSSPVNATLPADPTSATGTITDDDPRPTTTTISSDAPDPSLIGTGYVVQFTVAATGATPAGTVSVSDGTDGCGPVTLDGAGQGQCTVTSSTFGNKTLTATYTPGSGAFEASSDTEAHEVTRPSEIFADGFETP